MNGEFLLNKVFSDMYPCDVAWNPIAVPSFREAQQLAERGEALKLSPVGSLYRHPLSSLLRNPREKSY